MSVLHDSLAPIICEMARKLWNTLSKAYVNQSRWSSQEEAEVTAHPGKSRSLWSGLEMLRPQSIDPDVLNKRREQDKMSSPADGSLIQFTLRDKKLPTPEDVYSQVQKEEGSHGLLEAKKAEGSSWSSKEGGKKADEKGVKSEHCKRDGDTKERGWVLNPRLKPAKFR